MNDYTHKTAVELTNAYLKAILPSDAGPVQRAETKLAFMAGFFNALQVFNALGEIPDEECERSLERYALEMVGWAQTMRERANAERRKCKPPRFAIGTVMATGKADNETQAFHSESVRRPLGDMLDVREDCAQFVGTSPHWVRLEWTDTPHRPDENGRPIVTFPRPFRLVII